jgi:Methylamine utilisation protein MauE
MDVWHELVVASRGVVAGTLVVAAAAKLRDRRATRAALVASHLPAGLDLTLPVVEAFTALGLLVERRSAWAAYVACGLLGAFTVFLVAEAARGVDAPCPCFGAASTAVAPGTRAVVRNVVLIALAVVATGTAPDVQWRAWLWAAGTAVALVVWANVRRFVGGTPTK